MHKSSKNVSIESIKIGSILPLSGDFAIIGEEIKRGADIAVAELAEEGIHVEYVSEDDQFTAAKDVSAANKLVQIDKVDGVFTAVGEEALPTVQVFNENKVPLLVTWDSNADLKKAGPYIFSIGFNSEANAEKMAEYAYVTLKLRKLGIVTNIDQVADVLAGSFDNKFKSLGGSISSIDRLQPTETNYRTVASKLKSGDAEGVYMALIPPNNQFMMIQARQLGFSGQLLGVDSVQHDEIVQAGAAAEGLLFTSIHTDHDAALKDRYAALYKREPINITHVSFGYDAVLAFIEAKKIADEKDISLRDSLAQLSTDKTTTPINMGGNQYSERVEKIFKVSQGKSVLAE